MSFSAEVWSDILAVAEPQFVPGGGDVSFVVGDDKRHSRLAVSPAGGGACTWLPLSPSIKKIPRSGWGAYGWVSHGLTLIYIGADDRLHRHEAVTGESVPLTREPQSMSGLALSPTGNDLAVVVDTRHVCVLSLREPDAQLRQVTSCGDFALDPAWSPDGMLLAWHEWDSPFMPWHESRVMLTSLSDIQAPAMAVGGSGAVAQPRFSPDGRQLGFLSDREGWQTLWALDVDAVRGEVLGVPRRLVSPQSEHGLPSWGPGLRSWAWTGPNEVVVWRNENGCGALERWADGALLAVLRADIVAEGVTTGDNKIAAILGGPCAAPRLEVIEGMESTIVAYSAPIAIDRAGPVPQSVRWSSEGWDINARLYRPLGCYKTPSPLLVWLHQGPTGQALSVLDPRIAYFVERGWAVLAPDHRGSTGWGRNFMLALEGVWGVADAADVATGVEIACREGWAKPDSIVLYGGSAGGFLTLRLLAMRPDLFAAGVALFPVCHLLDTVTPPWRYQAHYIDRLLGGRMEERSPLEQASALRRPVLILHGSEDHIVPAWHSEVLTEAVNAAGGIVERYLYEGEGHGWASGETLADELRRIDCFLHLHVLSKASS